MIPNCKQEQKRLEKLEEDTGWANFELEDNFENLSWEPLAYRKIGKLVNIHGGGTLDRSVSDTIAKLPAGCCPRQIIQTPCLINASVSLANIKIDYDGTISCISSTSTNQKITIIINICFIARQ